MPTVTFPEAMSRVLRGDAARPLVTFYDDASGERTELSVATYANWVAKTAGLAQDELGVEHGALALLDLPTHWLGAVWLGAAWTMGLCVTDDRAAADRADLIVCGPDRWQEYTARALDVPVVALSLRPMGGRFTQPLPAAVTDYGAVVLAQPDVFVADAPPDGADLAWRDAVGTLSQADLLRDRTDETTAEAGGRLLTDVNPCSRSGLSTLLTPLAGHGSTIWVAHPDPATWSAKYDAERATRQVLAVSG